MTPNALPSSTPHAQPSMRRRLLQLQAIALVLVGLMAALLTFGLTWLYLNDEHDRTLEQVAQTIVRHGLEAENEDDPDPTDRGQFVSQLWAEDGTQQYPAEPDTGPPRQAEGWHTVAWQQQRWKVFTLLQDGLTIQVSQPLRNRRDAFWDLAPGVLLALVALVGALLALLRHAVNRSLHPLERLREQLGSQTVNAIEAHSPSAAPWPSDLTPLVHTIESLLQGVKDAQTAHRDTIVRATHELRTPLAALNIHLQLLNRAPDGPNASHLRTQTLAAAARLNRLVDQLLHLSDLETPDATAPPSNQPVWPALAPLHALWQPLAVAHQAELELDIPDNAILHGHTRAWLAMLDNLVHNAIRCTPSTSAPTTPNRIRLTLTHQGQDAIWTLTDHGPGMDERHMARLNQGLRPQADRHEGGTGLGLHIAMRAAQRHGGHLAFAPTPGGGLTITIHLPNAWQPHPAKSG